MTDTAHETEAPAATAYLLPLEWLALPPAPRPDEVSARLAQAAARRQSAATARDRLKATYAAAPPAEPAPDPMPPEARPLPARAVPRVEVPDTAANRLKAIRRGLRDLRGGGPVDLEELARPARLWPELQNAIWSGDRFKVELALGIAEAFLTIEAEKEKARRASRKTGNSQRPRRVSATKNVEALRRQYEADPQARLEAIQQACSDIKAGVVGDPLLQAECLRPWPAFYRAVVEIEGVDKLEMFGTALVRMTRALLDEELARERANASPRVQQGKPPANHNPI
jgi:hypothetical protein